MMLFSVRIIAAALLIMLLAACGQKGALFLAPQSVPYSFLPTATPVPTPVVPPTLTAPAVAASNQERKKVKTKSVKVPELVKKVKDLAVEKEYVLTSSVSEIVPPLPTEKITILEFIEPFHENSEKATWRELEQQDTKDLGF